MDEKLSTGKANQGALFDGGLPTTVNNDQLAWILGVTRQRITQLVGDGLPKIDRGIYPLDGAVQWVVAYWKQKNKNNAANMDAHRKRLLTAQAEKAEIDNQLRKRELIPVEVIASTLNQVGTTIASQLDALAPRLASELTNQSETAYVKKTISDETRQIRIAIADLLDDLAVNTGNGENNTPAAGTDGEPVGGPGTNITA